MTVKSFELKGPKAIIVLVIPWCVGMATLIYWLVKGALS